MERFAKIRNLRWSGDADAYAVVQDRGKRMTIHKKRQQGFSYIDVMIAIVILMVGVLAMVSALTANLIRSFESEKRVVAKQLALSSLESIISAKEISRPDVFPSFDAVRNVGTPPIVDSNGDNVFGIFLNGFNPIRPDEGADGVAGTADDACPLGSPCVVGTYTNNSTAMTGYERKIIITDVDDPERPYPTYNIARRRIEVHIKYYANQLPLEEVASTIITNYAN